MTADSFLWHDYETFGANPRLDRPCQFAARRSDDQLNPVGEPLVLYCQPTLDMLPHPDACLITGITPQQALRDGVPEYEFAQRIFEQMATPGTCTVGFNNLRFDDEFSRFLFWRNFIDPYVREYRNGNSRFDLIDLMRTWHALRPEGLVWPQRDDGHPSFRLEDLARANGLSVEHAHDALADVDNTLALAQRLRAQQPKLWSWALSLRNKHNVDRLLAARQALLHVTARYPAAEHCIAPVLPLFRHPEINGQWLVWNLRHDPTSFMAEDAELLAELYWNAREDLPEGCDRLPVKWVRGNRCPMLAPMSVLDDAARERTGIDPARATDHAGRLLSDDAFLKRLAQALAPRPGGTAADAESALYQGFVSNADRQLAERVASSRPEQLAEWVNADRQPFADARLNELLLHFVGRHAAHALAPEPRAAWEDYRRRRLLDDPELAALQLDNYRQRIDQLQQERPDRTALLDALRQWPEQLDLPR
ncbi:MAG: exodeoxyribonuclease I [Wenzhouxiangellaceae bacterium]|nr:exodeoxyribonuclease I [Wenzhouxiangellaceae bacterium]